jgi:7-carboxy-7-deazaguanine synthase
MVKEVFVTIQGEGLRAGTRAVFLRFTGCNLWAGTEALRASGAGACARWCDTDFTREGAHKFETAEELAQLVETTWGPGQRERWVVVTGGEPMLQLDRALVEALRWHGFKVAAETNGTVAPAAGVDWLCVSPKLMADGSFPKLAVSGADELKVVLGGDPDWSNEQLTELARKGHWRNLVVNAVDETAQLQRTVGPKFTGLTLPIVRLGLERCLRWVHANPDWRLGYQLHKVVGAP